MSTAQRVHHIESNITFEVLQQENGRLKTQVTNLQQQLNDVQKQLQQFMSSKRRSKSVKNTSDLLLKDRSTPQNKPNLLTNSSIETKINKDDAKNALMAKLMRSSTTPNVLTAQSQNNDDMKKYERMLKVGVDLSGVVTQMKKDNISPESINNFKKSHGWKDDESKDDTSNTPQIDLNDPKFAKYNRMKKLRMPMKTITNKMKLDGLSQLEMDVFSGKASNKPKETDPLKIAESLGLPKKPTIPKPVNQMKRVHWSPVELPKIKTSIWSHIDHQWFDYDPIMFELNFQTRKRKEKVKIEALKGKASGAGSQVSQDDSKKEEENVNFVDAKRSQMVQIGLKSFNMTNEQLRDTILTLDEEVR